MPWQSEHTGEFQLPFARALPCTLDTNWPAIDAWHLPHVRATLNLKMPDCGLFGGRIEWKSWQSVQTAAFMLPRAAARPCTLSSYESADCALSPTFCMTNFCA